MSAPDARKDELAARALSCLGEPPVPEGLAARITARATAAPQIADVSPDSAPSPAPVPLSFAPPVRATGPARSHPVRRRHVIAASIAAALLLSVGVYAGLRDRPGKSPAFANDVPTQTVPQSDPRAPSRLADAAPPAGAPEAAPTRREKAPPAQRFATVPAPVDPPVELAEEAPPAATPATGGEARPQEGRLAQTGPDNISNSGLRPVYGPPAPTGLGIAGGPAGGISLPGEPPSGGARGTGGNGPPPSGPPSGMPGPGGPHGPRM